MVFLHTIHAIDMRSAFVPTRSLSSFGIAGVLALTLLLMGDVAPVAAQGDAVPGRDRSRATLSLDLDRERAAVPVDSQATVRLRLANTSDSTAVTGASVAVSALPGLRVGARGASHGDYVDGAWRVGRVAPGDVATLVLTLTLDSVTPRLLSAWLRTADQWVPKRAVLRTWVVPRSPGRPARTAGRR